MNLWQRKNLIVGLAIVIFISTPLFIVFKKSNVKENRKKHHEIFELTDNLGGPTSQLNLNRPTKKKKPSQKTLSAAPKWGSSKAIGTQQKVTKKKTSPKKLKAKKSKKKKKKKIAKKKETKEIAPQTKTNVAENKKGEKAEDNKQPPIGGGNNLALNDSVTSSEEKNNALPPQAFTEGGDAVEQWKRYLINDPSYTKLNEFIRKHNGGIISDTVYFSVSEEMINNELKLIREYGIAALGSYPHPDSFSLLTNQLGLETENTTLRKIKGYLASYIRFNNLSNLITSIGDPSSITRHQVAIYLKRSVEYNLSGTNSQDPETLRQYQESYLSILPPLNTAITQESEAQVRTAMQDAKSQIERFTSGNVVAGFQ